MIHVTVPSVMHSGTHVVRYKILRAFFKDNEDCLFNGNSKNELTGFHVDQMYRFMDKMQGHIVVPMRHPRRIAKSFQSRARMPARRPYNEENLYEQLTLLQEVDKYNPMYIHIDIPEVRDKQVQAVSEALGLDLEYNWEPSRESGAVAGNHDVRIEDCPQVPQIFIQHYYKTAGLQHE